MPRFWRVLLGPRVITKGQVTKGPASPGQQVWIGRAYKFISSPSITTSWQGALLATLGFIDSTFLKIGAFERASRKPLGGSGSFKNANSSPSSRNSSKIGRASCRERVQI